MSVRKTKVFSFNVSSRIFKTYTEAIQEANATKIWLQRLCEKKGYSCKAIIGISKHNPRAGQVETYKSGLVGRPLTIFKRNCEWMPISSETAPHIHIIIYANPGDMVCSLLAQHLNNKYKRKVVWFNDCSKYLSEAIDYVLKQSIKLRKVEIDNIHILQNDDLGFYKAVVETNLKYENERISFTYNKPPEIPKKADIKTIYEDFTESKSLQCNQSKEIEISIYNVQTYNDLNRRNNIYTYLLKRMIPP